MSKRNSEKWLLLQAPTGMCSVVSSKDVISPASDIKMWSVVIVDRGSGTHEAATVIGFSRDREVLERQASQLPAKREAPPEPETAEVRNEPDEDAGDYSASGSSWAPSDAEENVSSDDEVAKKKLKLDQLAYRSYSNRRAGRVIKPSHRADAINAFIAVNKKNAEEEKENNKHTATTDKKLQPDSTRINNSPFRIQDSDIVSINIRDIMDMKRQFEELFTLIAEIKGSAQSSNQAEYINRSINPSAIKYEMTVHNTFNVENNVENNSDDNEQSRSEDLNRSEDNVLITNKYDNTNNNKSLEEVKNNRTSERRKKSNKHGKVENSKQHETENNKKVLAEKHDNKKEDDREWIPIGSGKTLIHKDQYQKVKWRSYTVATRSLLLSVFPRKILATHSLTGKKSPAFQNRPAKMCLDPRIVTDVVHEIVDRFNIKDSLVRSIITTKCADEAKMWKQRKQRRKFQPVKTVDQDYDDEEVNMTC